MIRQAANDRYGPSDDATTDWPNEPSPDDPDDMLRRALCGYFRDETAEDIILAWLIVLPLLESIAACRRPLRAV